MSGNNGLLYSNAIIDASKGIVDSDELTNRYNNIYTSIICYIEVLGYEFEDEEEKEIILEILQNIPVVNLNMEIANKAIEYRKKKKIRLPDAMILATAKYLNADLVTRNTSDFKNIDDGVIIVEPKLKK